MEIRLKRATQKDTLCQQLEPQRQMVQNLRGMSLVNGSDKCDSDKNAGKKQFSEKSRLTASREIFVEHEIDMETIVVLSFLSSLAILTLRKRELVTLTVFMLLCQNFLWLFHG